MTGERLRSWAIWLVAAHTAVVGIHSFVHVMVDVVPSAPADLAVIVSCFYVGPVCAAWAIAKGRRAGLLLLVASMGAGFAYGVLSHLALPGPDNVASVGGTAWGIPFAATSWVLAGLEFAAIQVAWLMWFRSRRPLVAVPASPTP